MSEGVHVVVLNWNNATDTIECIESLLRSEHAALDILLVDNRSTDDSEARLREKFPAIDLLQTGANLGYAGGNNRGIERRLNEGAEWILVVNNDTVFAPDCVAQLLAAIRSDERLGAVAPLIVRHDNPRQAWFAGGRLSMSRAIGVNLEGPVRDASASGPALGESELVVRCSYLCGCCILFRARTLREVGSFREDFFSYIEDVELSYRMSRAGWSLGWVERAVLRHKVPPAGTRDSPWQIRMRDRNRRRLVRSLFPFWRRVGFALWFWPTRLLHLAIFAARGDQGRARAIVAGMTER